MPNFWRVGSIIGLGLVLAACSNAGGGSGSAAPAGAATGPAVHMSNTAFIPPATTIQSGQSLTLIADTFAPHIIANGTWAGGAARSARELGAPVVADVSIAGNDAGSIGPFTTPGTFQLYCTIHPNVNNCQLKQAACS